jgi:REP element-mobilizing transposase RayT
VTFSCCQRRPVLGTPQRRDRFLEILEQVRPRLRFVVVGYVVMPKHVHLLVGEPERGDPSIVLQVLKQRFARWLRREQRRQMHPAQQAFWEQEVGVWQRRFLRFRSLEPEETAGEAALHAPQSGEAGSGVGAGAVAMEQLSRLCEGAMRAGAGK